MRSEPQTSTLSEDTEDDARSQHRFLFTAFCLTVATLWILPLRGSLWVDELGTYWVIKDGLRATIDRATHIQGQTPAYYVLEWLTRHLIGKSELALRLPSLLALIGAAYLLFRLGIRLFDRETAITAAIIFATLRAISFAAGDARPYGLAIFALVAATFQLVRWLDDPRWSSALGYVVLAASVVYVHYLFGLALLGHIPYVYVRRDRISTRSVVAVVLGIGLLLVPAAPQLFSLFHRRGMLSVPTTNFGQALADTLVPSGLSVGILLGMLLARSLDPLTIQTRTPARGAITLATSWLIVSPCLLFLVSAFTTVHIFADRYLSAAAPALALLAASAVIFIGPARARRIMVLTTMALAILLYGSSTHNNEDWRGAIARVNQLSTPSTPILVHSALVEAGQVSWLEDPYKASYLLDPIAYYPVKGKPVPMPYFFNATTQKYLETLLPTLRSSNDFFLMTRYSFVESTAFLEGRLASAGYSNRIVGAFGSVVVYEYKRQAP